MARISLNVCDLCKSTTKETLTNKIILCTKAKGAPSPKNSFTRKLGEICPACYEDLFKRLDGSFIPTTLKLQGEAKLVPSANKTPLAKSGPECTHEKRTF